MSHCPIRKCRTPIQYPNLMCKMHWYTVSRKTRDRVWSTFRESPGSGEHRRAVGDAILEACEVQATLDETV